MVFIKQKETVMEIYDIVRKNYLKNITKIQSNILIYLDNTSTGFKIQQRRKQIRAQISARQWRR